MVFGILSAENVPRSISGSFNQIIGTLELLAIVAMLMSFTGMGAYIFGPGIKNRLILFTNDEVFGILARFQENGRIASSQSIYLLVESYDIISAILKRGFPNLRVQLDDVMTDIQIAMRTGSENEKNDVGDFFNSIRGLRRQSRRSGFSASVALLNHLNALRNQLLESEKFRSSNHIEGAWEKGFLRTLKPYEGAIQIILLILTAVASILFLIFG